MRIAEGQTVTATKIVRVYTSRDVERMQAEAQRAYEEEVPPEERAQIDAFWEEFEAEIGEAGPYPPAHATLDKLDELFDRGLGYEDLLESHVTAWKEVWDANDIIIEGDPAAQLYEAAAVDGATGWQSFRHITLPLLRPSIFFVVTLGLIGTYQVFDQVYVMTAGGPAKTTMPLAYLVYRSGFNSSAMGLASATSVLLFIIIFVMTLAQRRIVGERAAG